MEKQVLLDLLKKRFLSHSLLHPDINFDETISRLSERKLTALAYMEESGGEPDIVLLQGKLCFVDTSAETPLGRRGLCYDEEARNARKANKPISSVKKDATEHGLSLLNEEEYFALQKLGDFDLKTQSWLLTPEQIRQKGGALFGDKRYGRAFIYHNGADSYYSVRGYRAKLEI